MGRAQRDVERTVRSFVSRAKRGRAIELDTPLFAEGIGLDSLETAELSAILEDELGHDPFSEGSMPQTVGEILDYYETPAAEA